MFEDPSAGLVPPSEGRDGGPSAGSRHWWPFLAGLIFFVLGPVAYLLQIRLKDLATPWYLPALSTAGVALMILSLWRRRGIVRGLILIPFVLLCGLEWYGIGVASRTPSYAGLARPGSEIPRFASRRADGSPFTEADLRTGPDTVVVFYRGRW